MILPVTGTEYAKVFAELYNSANMLFSENERADAGEEAFYRQLRKDCNFLYIIEGEACGFMSWHKYAGYYELTSLYVKRSYQGRKVGHELLTYFEGGITEDACILIKVLKNAPWALNFYKKHGYETLNEETRELLKSWNIKEKSWENIFFKQWKMRERQ